MCGLNILVKNSPKYYNTLIKGKIGTSYSYVLAALLDYHYSTRIMVLY